MQPHSKVFTLQFCRRHGCVKKVKAPVGNTQLSKEEWKKYGKAGEQLDTMFSRSIMIEVLYLTLKCIQIQGNNRINQIQDDPELDNEQKMMISSFRSEQVDHFLENEDQIHFDGGGMNILDINFEVSEQQFLDELCLGDEEKILKINDLRVMHFGHHNIWFNIHEQQVLQEIKESTKKMKQFEFMLSFNIGDNFDHFMKACKMIRDKPSAINIKFETFDRKFSVNFAEFKEFKNICKLVQNYNDFIKTIRRLHRASLARFDSNGIEINNTSLTSRQPEQPEDKMNINDEHSFILEVFGIYQLKYRWFKAVKLIVFDQTSHFSIVDRSQVIMRFEIRMKQNQGLKTSAKRLEKLKQIATNIKAGNHSLNSPLDQLLSANDLKILANNQELKVLDFLDEDITLIKKRLKRDFFYLCSNDITNFSVQLMVENNVHKLTKL